MHPVVLIPGIGGSILVPKGHEYRMLLNRKVPDNRWIHIYAFTKKEIDKWKKDMEFHLITDSDGKIQRMIPKRHIVPFDVGGTKGVTDIIPEFSMFPPPYQNAMEEMFHYRYFHPICEAVRAQNCSYKDHKTLLGVPNDFRFILDSMIMDGFFYDLKTCIETGCYITGKPGVIVSHSLGGILFKWFLSTHVDQDWIDKHIHRWVCISAPFGGSYHAIKAVTCGEHYVPALRPFVQEQMQTITGIIMCLPNQLAFDIHEPLLFTDEGTLTIEKYGEYANKGRIPFKIWKDLYEPNISTLKKQVKVKTHMIFSDTVPTYGIARASSWDALTSNVQLCDGDGIVPAQSLSAYKKVLDLSKVEETRIKHCDHTDLLSDKRTIDIIRSYL